MNKWLVYTFRELLRNTPEHAGTGEVWVAAQLWPTKKSLEIAVLDNGVGVLESLRRNPAINVDTHIEALKMAVQPGVSSVPEGIQAEDDEWGNSGYGLYVLSRLATETEGKFQLISGDKAFTQKNQSAEMADAHHQGTAIKMVVNPGKLEKFDQFMSRIVPEGESMSKRRASAMSKISG